MCPRLWWTSFSVEEGLPPCGNKRNNKGHQEGTVPLLFYTKIKRSIVFLPRSVQTHLCGVLYQFNNNLKKKQQKFYLGMTQDYSNRTIIL